MSAIRTLLTSVFILSTITLTAEAATSCRAPLAPSIPNGVTAEKTEILAALKAIKKDFQPAIKNFQNCVATEKEAVGDVATKAQIAEWDMLYDAAYGLETQVAEAMNVAIRAYKARIADKADPKKSE
ncbi:MAG: hypothetical protein COB54_08760 [Alphaproteobacteria bacterium]|nr:MAG: hypothetical protein COB54_08760 [Alphaproteobacteria bacterium]